jgi:hypothetical protein
MQIANPIYDAVFKYMMEDNDVAKLLVSKILDEEVVKLDFLPQENIVDVERRSLTVYRMDFKAQIKTLNGEKTVIIEVQKAKFPTDIIRFRKYLGEQYIKSQYVNIPIVSIYFLGYGLDHIKAPVVKVQREYIDLTTNTVIYERESFIESLTHDSYVIQVKYLKAPYKSELEQFLMIFDQSEATGDAHFLKINENEYPEVYEKVMRRLIKAASEPDIRREMEIEDEIIQVLDDLERSVEEQKNTIEEQKKALEEKDKVLEEKDKVLEEKDRLLEEQKKIIEELMSKKKI